MIDAGKLLDAFKIEHEPGISDNEAIKLVAGVFVERTRRMDELMAKLEQARSFSLSSETATLKASVARLEAAIKAMPTEAEKERQHRADVAYGRLPR